jgi:hypothetical protein
MAARTSGRKGTDQAGYIRINNVLFFLDKIVSP